MTAKPKKLAAKVQNPRYKGATPEMVGRALLRRAKDEAPKQGGGKSKTAAA